MANAAPWSYALKQAYLSDFAADSLWEVYGSTELGVNTILAPADQLRWLAEQLGPASFANPTLMMFAGQGLGYVEPGVKSQSEVALRADRMAIQCPKCKRKTAHAA